MDKLDLEAIDCARTQLGIDRTHAFACMVSPCTCSAKAEDQRDMDAIARLTTLKRRLQSLPQGEAPEVLIRDWVADLFDISKASATLDAKSLLERLAHGGYEIRPVAPDTEVEKWKDLCRKAGDDKVRMVTAAGKRILALEKQLAEAQGTARIQDAADDLIERIGNLLPEPPEAGLDGLEKAIRTMVAYGDREHREAERLRDILASQQESGARSQEAGTGAPGVRECWVRWKTKVPYPSIFEAIYEKPHHMTGPGWEWVRMVEADNQAPRGQREGEA